MEVNYIKQNTKRTKLLVSIIYTLFFVVSMGLSFLPKATAVMATMDTAADSDVTNSASFSTDTIYQIVTDRFFDGDSTNNPTELYTTRQIIVNITEETGRELPKN